MGFRRRTVTRGQVVSALVLVLGSSVLGCTPGRGSVERDLIAEAEALMDAGCWGGAIPLLKQRLLEAPDDAGAHFYLGRCYINDKQRRRLAIAEGELETALNLFIRQGRQSPIRRFKPLYFEFICHAEMLHVVLEQIVFLLEHGAAPPILAYYAEKAERIFEEAQRLVPTGPDIENMRSLLDEIRALQRTPPPLRRAPGPARHVRSPSHYQRADGA